MYCCIVIIFESIVIHKNTEFLVWPAWTSEFGYKPPTHTHTRTKNIVHPCSKGFVDETTVEIIYVNKCVCVCVSKALDIV